jgi:hypothetical protein
MGILRKGSGPNNALFRNIDNHNRLKAAGQEWLSMTGPTSGAIVRTYRKKDHENVFVVGKSEIDGEHHVG